MRPGSGLGGAQWGKNLFVKSYLCTQFISPHSRLSPQVTITGV